MPANSCKVTDLEFLVSCLNHADTTSIKWDEIASECGMTTTGAAQQKFGRVKKANTIKADGSSGGADGAGAAKKDARSTKKQASKAPASKKRKVNEDDEETKIVKTEEDRNL